MQSRLITAIALTAAVALPAGAMAAATPSSPSGTPSKAPGASAPPFEQLDTNKDGFISLEEAKKSATISQRFKDLDLDRDGKLSRSEMEALSSPAAGSPDRGGGSSTPKKY